jgi:hypothetical protein
LGFSPCDGASGAQCLPGDNSEQCTGVFRHHENPQGALMTLAGDMTIELAKKKAQGLKPRSVLGLDGPTKVVP